ncbi:hypothetical protein J6590_095803 [Homalodisca vitripennis]|nr:hypothetical protein J6590_095803 [Homalodisca vitripennis]
MKSSGTEPTQMRKTQLLREHHRTAATQIKIYHLAPRPLFYIVEKCFNWRNNRSNISYSTVIHIKFFNYMLSIITLF